MAFYKDGVISIPNVTGDVVITATAVAQAAPYTNLADPSSPDWMDGHRLNSSVSQVEAAGHFIANFIPCVDGDVIRIRGIVNPTTIDNMYAKKVDETYTNVLTTFYARVNNGASTYDEATKTLTWTAYLVNSNGGKDTGYANYRAFRSSFMYAAGFSASDIIITVNEEIP